MYTKLKKIEEGFTIVEVLIVLAIAALILAIVLIAVPDLQRSSRNTDILHDAQNTASAIQTYEGNNSGTIPTFAAGAQTLTGSVLSIGSTGSTSQAHVQASDTIFAESGVGSVTYEGGGAGATASTVGVGGLFIDTKEDCGSYAGPTGTGRTAVPGTYTLNTDARGVAVLYPIEGASTSGSSIGCIQE